MGKPAPSQLHIAKWVANEWREEWAASDEPTCGERGDEPVQALRPAGGEIHESRNATSDLLE